MIFAEVELADAEGLILAHTHQLADGPLKKGRRLTAADLAALRAAGLERVHALRLEPGDLDESAAAGAIAARLVGPWLRLDQPQVGRCNVIATRAGLFGVAGDRVEALNLADEAVVLATLEPLARVAAGQAVATVKVIPFALAGERVERACAAVGSASPLRLHPFRPRRAALLLTTLPGLRDNVLAKAERVTAERLAGLDCELVRVDRCDHTAAAVAAALQQALAAHCDLLLVSGASMTVDRGDAIPAGLLAAGGEIERFGLPVEPGNMLLLGRCAGVPVIDLPGCGRSPKLNGLDRILERLVADVALDPGVLARLGVGGLLRDSVLPVPTLSDAPDGPEPGARRPLGAVVLAAGRSTRMHGGNKLLAKVHGRPLVVQPVEAALAAGLAPVVVVTGHDHAAVAAALADYPVSCVHNPAYADGMAGSLRCGLEALPEALDGALILLGDMPGITAGHLRLLIEPFAPEAGRGLVVPTRGGRRGNPILWARRYFAEMRAIEGDTGARGLLQTHAGEVHLVAMPDDAIFIDVDTDAALDDYCSGAG